MTEAELKKLKDIPTPAPRAEARKNAISVALDVFDADAATLQSVVPLESKKVNPAQPDKGKRSWFRLTRMTSDTTRRQSMRVSTNSNKASNQNFFTPKRYALAASVAALMIAAPIAFHMMKTEPPMQVTGVGGGIMDMMSSERPVEARRVPTVAVAKKPTAAPPAPAPVAALESDSRKQKAVATNLSLQERELGLKQRRNDAVGNVGKILGDLRTREQQPVQDVSATVAGASPKPVDRARPQRTAAGALSVAGGPQRASGVAAGDGFATAGRVSASAPAKKRSVSVVSANHRQATHPHESRRQHVEQDRDQFEGKVANPVKQVATNPVSTFSIDVDTASYAVVRRWLMQGRLPPKAAVRVEEMINYFPYDYAAPDDATVPFKASVTVTPSPWNASNKLVHIAIKGHDIKAAERPRANLVFLIDVSGSMGSPDKLPLLKSAFLLLLNELQPDDTVALVTYASGSGVALKPTKVSEKAKILSAIADLGAGGSTAGAQGIQDAYQLAQANFDKSGVNRIILATDGDFNVGVTDRSELKSLIEQRRKAGIFLSVLGFGRGNYNDALMQTLAQNGNGTAAYIDTLNEARKVLVDEASSTLFTIAKDVKIQIEFNPAQVREYRLVGYETRALRQEDFNNDKVDAGDIGSGHTVTAIYEVTPIGAPKLVDDLRYQKQTPQVASVPDATTDTAAGSNELGFLKLRYKLPNEQASKLQTVPITSALERVSIGAAGQDVRFSTAVSAFGQLLGGSQYMGDYTYDDVLALAQSARGTDTFGYRAEFLNLVRLAKSAKR